MEFVERGDTYSDQVLGVVQRLFAPVEDAGVDTLLLGCTHYPFLARTIGDVMGRDVVLVSSADETAFAVAAQLAAVGLTRRPREPAATHRFFSSGGRRWFPPPGPAAAGTRARPGGGDPVGLSLTVLGCSGSYPGRGMACSGYLVQGGGVNVVIDMGPGTLANLQRHIGLGDVDAVILSHRHPDHWTDITGLEVAWKYGLKREGLPVYTTPPRPASSPTTSRPWGWHRRSSGTPHGGMVVAIGELRCRFAYTEHYVETLAVRVDDLESGRSLAYSSDTGPAWSLTRSATASISPSARRRTWWTRKARACCTSAPDRPVP